MTHVVIAGGGIGGLSAALALARVGVQVSLFERAAEFSEVGAGIQLGSNVMRVLYNLGLESPLNALVSWPECLQIRSAIAGIELGRLTLGSVFSQRYGAPYATIARADLHNLLLQTLRQRADVSLQLNNAVLGLSQGDFGITAKLADTQQVQADLLVAADGGWSSLRQLLLHDGTPQPTGHLAYRAMVQQSDLPLSLRSQQVTVWLGPRLHVVQYPVRSGQWLNVVAIVHGKVMGDVSHWDHSANATDLQRAMAAVCAPLNDLIHAIGSWRLWPLSIRTPMKGPQEHVHMRVALLGDAAHPMLPYLAQGAAMAIEDAAALAWALAESCDNSGPKVDVPAQLQRYAVARWQRNAQVQARAIRNGEIFHASGPLRWGRDLAMRLLGENLLDMPWLYGSKAHP